MIQVVGVKRILVLVILFAANAALAAATYMYVEPESAQLERKLKVTRSKISTKRAETDQLRNDFEQIQQQKERFENLQQAGFISDQNRLVARRRIMDVQQYSRVLRAGFEIASADIVNRKSADEIDYVVLSSPITVEVEAMDDVDLYSFIYWMENAFPGHIATTNIIVTRKIDINETVLRGIGSGSTPTLVNGKLNFVWRTMVPEKDVVQSSDFDSGDF